MANRDAKSQGPTLQDPVVQSFLKRGSYQRRQGPRVKTTGPFKTYQKRMLPNHSGQNFAKMTETLNAKSLITASMNQLSQSFVLRLKSQDVSNPMGI